MEYPAGNARTRLLFVCLGNICRSPLAEGIFLHLARERGWEDRFEVDSAGLGDWHCGSRADPRSLAIAASHGIEVPSICRQITRDDFTAFDLVIGMDKANLKALHGLAAQAQCGKIKLMRQFDPQPGPEGSQNAEVPDPYHGDARSFEIVFDILHRSCMGLLASLEPPPGKRPS